MSLPASHLEIRHHELRKSRLTMVDGKVLYKDGEFMTLDRQTLLAQARAGAQVMRDRLAAAR